MASSLESVRRGASSKLGLFTLVPLAILLVIVSFAMLAVQSGDSDESALMIGQRNTRSLVLLFQARMQVEGLTMLNQAEQVLQAAAPGAGESIVNPASRDGAAAQLTRSVLRPLNSRLTGVAPAGCLMLVLGEDSRIVASLNSPLERGRFRPQGFGEGSTGPVQYMKLSGEEIEQLLSQELRTAAGQGDVLLQAVMAPIVAASGERAGHLFVARLLNGSNAVSEQIRASRLAKASLLTLDGKRVATAVISGESAGVGSSSLLPVSRIPTTSSLDDVTEDGAYVVSYEPLFGGGAPIGIIEVALPTADMTVGSSTAYVLSAVLILVVVLGIGFGLFKSRWNKVIDGPLTEIVDSADSVRNGLAEMQKVTRTVTGGDYSARVKVVAEDEVGQLANSMNSMLDSISALMQTEVDRDRLQKQIGDLLDIVSSSAEGDLTRRAEVTADVMGALADSFNMMSEQLGALIHEVQATTTQVGQSTTDIVDSTEEMAHGAEEQVLQINNAATAIEAMAVAISQVAENADAAVEAGRRTTEAALKGGEAVAKAIDAMYRIRNTVQQTADRIKRLGESSQEIGDIVHLIDNIATQTNLLALNAAIEAARAGEAGRGFGVVADEVRRLADRSTKAANDISTLVQGIQAEVTESVAAMEQGVAEVADGVNLADEAGNALNEIVSVAQQSADLIQEISLSSRQQRTASESVVGQMVSISKFSEQAATSSQQSAAAAAQLGELAERLRASVSRFRLPE